MAKRRLDDLEQMRHDLVLAKLLRGLGDHGQVAFQRPHLPLRHDEMRPLQTRLGDVAAEHPLRHDLRLDLDRLPACGASVIGKLWWNGSSPPWNPVESRMKPSPPSQSSSSTGSPAHAPGTRRGREPAPASRQPARISDGDAGLAVTGGERPSRDRMLAGIAPGAQLFQAARDPLLTPLFVSADQRYGTRRWVTGAGCLGDRARDSVLVAPAPGGNIEMNHRTYPHLSPSPDTLDLT